FKKYVLSDENYKRWVTSDDGTVVKFGSMVIPMQPSGRGKAYSGPMIRKDLLDMVGLPVPETIDEWYNLLKTFKTNFPDIMPFVWSAANNSQNSFTGAFDVQKGFYQVNGKVKYGPMEPGYLEFMRLMHQWTKEGLVSAEYVNVDQIMQALKGASCDISLYRYNTYRAKVIPQNPNAILVAAPYPVRKKGDVYHFGDEYVGVAFEGKFVTTACKYPVEAVKFIDYMYSPESSDMMNWGIEGESYVIVDGKRVETQRMKDPAERCKYILNQFRGFVDEDQNAQQYPFAEQHEAWEIWGSSGTDYKFPVGYTMTTEENTEYTQIMSEIDKFVNETYQAMILGKQSLDTFDQYVSKLKEMKIERALEIWQATLDRYYSR
ncbi:MAG: extracellular solute-binding protein, partial [Clostridiaceae bacterium]|nr:extracellular solute-binding protein [Clostridiaceae bacterium]